MGTSLTGTEIKDTYDSLLKISDNGPISGTLKTLTDGLGNDSALALSTSAIKVTGSISGTNGFNGFAGATHNLLVDWSASSQFTTLTATDVFFGTNANERMRITSAGNVGIGTNNPSAKLHVSGENIIVDRTGGDPFIEFYTGGTTNNVSLYGGASTGLRAFVGGSERMRITSSGNVGIGTSNPLAKLAVSDGTNAFYVTHNANGAYISSANNANTVYKRQSYDALEHLFFASASEKMRITSGGNVGIGTDSPNMPLEVVGSTANLFGNVYATSRFLQDKTDYRGLFLGYDTSGQNAVIAAESAGGTSNLAFYTYNGSSWGERARVTSNGLTFNGDTAAANALDDYEEGTWTMGISFGGASVGVVYANNTGTYTKIGRQVTVNGRLDLGSKGSSTGAALLTGLPFTIANTTGNWSAASLRFNLITFANQMQAFGVINTTTLAFTETTEAGVSSDLTDADFSNTSDIMFSFTYFV